MSSKPVIVKPTNRRLIVDNDLIRVSEGRNAKFRSGRSYIAEADRGLVLAIGAGIASLSAAFIAWLKKK